MPLTIHDFKDLEKKGYRFVGLKNHAAVKICHWTKKSIVNEGVCYKEKFYGIKSHRCLQMSPSISFCHHKCLFCWRDISITQTEWNEEYDEPADIIDGCIEAQKNLLCGFFGNSQLALPRPHGLHGEPPPQGSGLRQGLPVLPLDAGRNLES